MMNKILPLSATIGYKYVYNMPITKKSIFYILDNIIDNHLDKLMNKKEELWVSLYAHHNNKKYFQILLDIDSKHISENKIFNFVKKLFNNKRFRNYFTTIYSGNGYHISSNFFIDIDKSEDMEIKKWLQDKLKDIPGLDLSIIRDNPIRRIGYRNDLNMWMTIAKDNIFAPSYAKTFELTKSDLLNFIRHNLIPYKHVYSINEAELILTLCDLHKKE